MLKKLLSYVKQYTWSAVLTPVTILGEVILEVNIPLLMSKIIDIGIPNGDIPYVLKTGALMVLMAIGSLICGYSGAKLAVYASNGAAKNLRLAMFEKIESYSFKNTDKFSTASLITRLTNDITNVQQSFQMMIRLLARAPLMLILATVYAVRINAELSVIVLIAIPILASLMIILSKTAFPRFEAMLKRYDSMNARTQEALIAIRVVKAYVKGDYETESFNESAKALKYAQRNAEKILIVTSPLMQFVMYACTIAAVWLGGQHVLDGKLQSGSLISFITYLTQILSSLMMVAVAFVGIVLSSASGRRICEVLDEKPAIDDCNADRDLKIEEGSIVFEEVCFSYSEDPNNLTLDKINLSIKPGEVIGIIGGSGSGKTSLVQLIPRLYDVLSGSVKISGHDVKEFTLNNLRNQIGMVLQKNVLFSGTIEDNIRWGNPDASDDEIVAACKAAAAHEFISAFPNGYKTELGQGGINVSGGQKQRLCIARALIKKPKILILDDSTSAVDTATDSKIRESFRTQLPDTTKLIIAQRITSIAEADRIIVLEDGKINAIGTHEELLKTNAIYQEVYSSQQKGVA